MIMVACNPVEADRLHVAMHMEEPHTVVNTRQQHEITQPRQHLKVLHRGHLLQHTRDVSKAETQMVASSQKEPKALFSCQYRCTTLPIQI